MQESTLNSTAASLEEALVATLASTSLDDSTTSNVSSSSPQPPQDDQEEDAYKDGDLPEFSDHEEDAQDEKEKEISPPKMMMVPGKGMKGPAGRKKMPLSALKQRMTGVGKKSSSASSESSPVPSTSTSTSTSNTAATKPPKGKGKALKMTDEQLDMVISRFTAEKPELQGKVGREEMLQMIELLQIDEDTLKGKKGLMGKGNKDTGYVESSLSSFVIELS